MDKILNTDYSTCLDCIYYSGGVALIMGQRMSVS